ncbi:MAG: hypothetical protein EXX96DRAFT_504073 [Benjaminiella poitrasii]|nr:MAG: hypothetical protein EXX96DRAFT_504073 [Benjaminiella poitrasii]
MGDPINESIVSSCIISRNSSSSDSPAASTGPCRSSVEVDLEDGPLFRATLKDYESRTSTLKHQLKRILKAATVSFEAKCLVLEQDKQFMSILREAPFAEPLFTHYLDEVWDKLNEQQERLTFCMQNLLIAPLQKLYDCDLKTAETKRRQFEDVSKEYYSNLSKYLGMKTSTSNSSEKRKLKAESEFTIKKRHFDLVRFEYFAFLKDLHGGKKEQEILYHLLNHHEKQYAFFQSVSKTLLPYKAGLDEIASKVAEASREQKIVSQERDEKRRLLISKYALSSPIDVNKHERRKSSGRNMISSSPDALSSPPPLSLPPILSPPILPTMHEEETNRFKGIRDMEQQDLRLAATLGRKKEGFLFAPSKPSKNNNNAFDVSSTIHWHKYWCVVSGGQLHEYVNWKKQLEQHMDPINLRFATVREARDVDRRFCFEVITPHFRRLYQATSKEELTEWLATIQNAITGLLNGTGSSLDLSNERMAKKSSSGSWLHSRSLSGALSGLAAAKERYLRKKKKRGNSNVKKFSPSLEQSSSKVSSAVMEQAKEEGCRLLNQLREVESNKFCADCSAKDPEWCSLNLGILLCIECSGIHRSLGTHISKIRSLTLDSASFTPEIIQLLMSIGNSKSNNIWDAQLNNDTTTSPLPNIKKPIPSDTRDTKLKYIQAKYVQHAFVVSDSSSTTATDPMDLLYTAIENNNIPQAMHAIALGADVNTSFSTQHHQTIPLVDLHKTEETVELPYLDSAGKKVVVTYPVQRFEQAYKDLFVVRYALHLALLSVRRSTEDDVISSSSSVGGGYTIGQSSRRPSAHHARYHSDNSSLSQHSISDSESSSDYDSMNESLCSNRQFTMAEFLLQNGADVSIVDRYTGHSLAVLIGLGDLVDDEALEYLNAKNSLRGQAAIHRSQSIPQPILLEKEER